MQRTGARESNYPAICLAAPAASRYTTFSQNQFYRPNSNIAVFSRNKTSVLLNYTGIKPVSLCNNNPYLDQVILESVWVFNGTIHRENPLC